MSEAYYFPQEAIDLCVNETKNCYVSWEMGNRRWRAFFWLDVTSIMHCGYMRNDFLSGDRPDSEKMKNESFEKLLVNIMNQKVFIDADELLEFKQFTDDETGEISYGYTDKPRVVLYAKASDMLL